MDIDMIDTEVKIFTWYNSKVGYEYMVMWTEDDEGRVIGDRRRFRKKLNPPKANNGRS